MAWYDSPTPAYRLSPAQATVMPGDDRVHVTLPEGGDRRALCGLCVPAGEGKTTNLNVSCPGCAQSVQAAVEAAWASVIAVVCCCAYETRPCAPCAAGEHSGCRRRLQEDAHRVRSRSEVKQGLRVLDGGGETTEGRAIF